MTGAPEDPASPFQAIAEKNPPKLNALENADQIQYLITDADNNLWDWVGMHAEGMDSMAVVLSTITGIAYVEIQESMKRVYMAAKTLDFSNLVESMDVIQAHAAAKAETIMFGDEQATQRARAVMHSSIIADLVIAAKKAYDRSRDETFRLYPGIMEAFKQIVDRRKDIKIIILTDAPHHKTIQRLKRFKLEDKVSKMFGQVQKKLRFDDKVEFTSKQKYLEPYFDAIRAAIPYQTSYSDQALISSGILRTPFQCVVMDAGERKPRINLARRLGLTEEQVHTQVAVWGDNALKDGGLACGIYIPDETEKEGGEQTRKVHNPEAAAYFYSEYGQTTDPYDALVLKEFGSAREVSRNLSMGEKALEELKQTQEKFIEKGIQTIRTQIKKVVHPIQILDLLGIERPDNFKSKD